MKKYIYGSLLALASVVMFTACSADEGTEPGNDSNAHVTLYSYTAELPYDADCDALVRVAANSATTEAYALTELASEKEARVAALGEQGYADYVVANGKKLDGISGVSTQDVVFQNLPNGENAITVVAVGNSGNYASAVSFTAVGWSDIATGTYYFATANIQHLYAASTETTLQVRDDDPDTYRFKNLFGTGSHLTMKAAAKGTDSDGAYTMVRVPSQATGLSYGSYSIYVRDVAEWQNDDGYLDCVIYDASHYAYFWVQYFASAGNFGYGYDEFVPND